MAEIVISIGAKISEYLVGPTLRQLRYIFCFNNIVEDLEKENRKLIEAQEQVENDVNRAIGNAEKIRKDVETWLTDANTIIADVKSLKNEAQGNKSCLNGWCPNWCCRYRLSRKAAEKKPAIVKLQEKGKFPRVGDPATLPNTGFFSSEDFLSSKATESATNEIMQALEDDNVNMIGLHGMGGVGKTTLVNELGGRAKELKLFNEVVIAVVSQTPNVENIQGQIADSLRLKFDQETKDGRASRLWLRLQSENMILIILDDVWDYLDLRKIGIPFGNHHKGCKILVTTRRQHVCTSMRSQTTIKLDVLSEDEEWALFKKNTVLANDSSTTLSTVARKVARECKGLPLAIVTVGRALRGKTLDEWMIALEQLKNSRFVNIQDVDQEIYQCLQLSYDYLKRKEIQSCFLLCSLFPEGYEINIEDLARIGWGIGLFQEDKTIEEARREMRVMIKTLQDSGLLMGTGRDQFVKMHDMVRDVALWIASKGENVFLVKTGAGLKTWPHDRSLERYTAISLMANNIEELPNGLVCPNLSTLLLDGDGVSMTISDASFEGMKALNVLRIRRGIFMPQSLQFLTNLQTLHVEYCKFNDISSLGKLKKLRILRLCGSTIVELPNEIGELNNLKLLDLSNCLQLKRIPPDVIRCLWLLEELYIGCYMGSDSFSGSFTGWEIEGRSVERSNASITELNSLSRLAVLSVDLNPKCLPQDFSFHNLLRYDICLSTDRKRAVGYPQSRRLYFYLIDPSSAINAFKELFQTVQLLNLEDTYGCQNIIPNMEQGGLNDVISLDLQSCREMECLIDSTEQQVPATAFSNLVDLYLAEMTDLREMCNGDRPPKGFLQKLKTLRVKKCYNMRSIFPKQLLRRLQNLEEVTVCSCNELQELFVLEGPTHHVAEGNHMMLLSNLTSLYLVDLPELKCIWKGPSQHVSLESLRDVQVENCNRLTYLFSSSLAQSLIQLQRLKIWECHELEQIIITKKEDGEISAEAHLQPLCFPKLTTLDVIACEKLKYIFPFSIARGLHSLEVPATAFSNLVNLSLSGIIQLREICYGNQAPEGFLQKLKTLKVQECNNIHSIFPKQLLWRLRNLEEVRVGSCDEVQELFGLEGPTHHLAEGNHVMLLSNLTLLDLCNLPELKCIWNGPSQHVSLESLRDVQVENCNRLTYLFSSSLARSLIQLQRLKIWECHGLEQIISTEKEDGEISSEAHLQPLCFPKLTTLEITSCEKLQYIFPISIARGLQQLKELSIYHAPQLKQVFGYRREEDVFIGDGNNIVLPQLRKLELVRLSSFTSFYEGNYHWMWPSLQELTVLECPKLTTSFTTDLEAELRALQKELRVLRLKNGEGVQEVFHGISTDRDDKLSVSNLEKLFLEDLPELRVIWKGPTQISSFQNLTSMEVTNCKKLMHIFSPSVARILPRLEYLIIKRCEELVRIIGEEDKHELKGHLQQPICFPNLKEIRVEDCSKLKSLFSITIARGLQQLKTLWVERDSHLEEVFRHENKEDVNDEKKIVLHQLTELFLIELPRFISFCSGGYHFIFPSLNSLRVNYEFCIPQ